jgi:hypothetical protein
VRVTKTTVEVFQRGQRIASQACCVAGAGQFGVALLGDEQAWSHHVNVVGNVVEA